MRSISLLLALVTVAPLGHTQTSKPKPKPTWPKLSPKQAERAKLALRKLKSEDSEVVGEGIAKLTAIGPAAAQLLLRKLAGRDEALFEPVAETLDRVLMAEHSPLLVPLLKRRQLPLRRYVLLRLARFHDAGLKPHFQKALGDKDEDIVYHAALGLAGVGDFAGLDTILARCREDWAGSREIVAEVLEPARSSAAAKALSHRMGDADTTGKVTILRLMRSLCPRELAGLLKTHLDTSQHSIKKAAINALRAVVDGDAPLEKLSVFQAIEHAKKWKARS